MERTVKKFAPHHAEYGNPDDTNGAEAKAYLAEAELLLAQAKSPPPAPSSQPDHAGKREGPGKDPKSQAILAKLEQPIAMSFGTETPLEDFLKYIKQATTEPNYPGIPIYVDPMGLQEADKTMTSTVQLELEGIPLRRTLQLAFSRSAWCISSMMDSWSSLPRSRKIRDCDPLRTSLRLSFRNKTSWNAATCL